jgi:hypothetical protein
VHSTPFGRLRVLCAALLFGLVQIVAAAAADERGTPIAKKLAVEDIRLAVKRAEAIHPNLYWYADRDVVRARMKSLIAALPDPATPMDVYLALAEILGLLGDGHVVASRPTTPDERGDLIDAYLDGGGTVLAVTVQPVEGGLAVVTSRTAGIAKGDVLKTINGTDALTLFDRATALEPGEPGLQRYFAAEELPWLLWDLGLRPPFKLTGSFGGVAGDIAVAGADRRAIQAKYSVSRGIEYKLQPDSIGLIVFNHMTDGPNAFDAKLADMFERIAQDKPRGLIVDLRGNHGGYTGLGDALLDYVSNKPHRPFAEVTVRASPECRAFFESDFPGSYYDETTKKLPEGARRTRNVDVETPGANPLRYRGPVAVLIGPGTFSSANILANSIADFGLATLIGRDTAEIANNFGMPCPFTLPNTGISLTVPGTYSVRANGDEASREVVHPHIAVPWPTDRLPAEDVDMAAARSWLLAQPERLQTEEAAQVSGPTAHGQRQTEATSQKSLPRGANTRTRSSE